MGLGKRIAKVTRDIDRRHNKRKPIEKQWLKSEYFKKKNTAASIAGLVGCSKMHVLNEIRRYGWEPRPNTDAQVLDRYSAERIRFYKNEYKSGKGFDTIARENPPLNPNRLSKIAKQQGWFIPRAEWIKKFRVGENSNSTKAKLKKLQNNGVRVHSMDGFRSTVDYVSRLIASTYLDKKTGYHLDHRYSVHDAFYNVEDLDTPISVSELCHPVNLRYVHPRKNLRKNKRSNFSAGSLRRKIARWNEKFGNPFTEKTFGSYNFQRWDSVS